MLFNSELWHKYAFKIFDNKSVDKKVVFHFIMFTNPLSTLFNRMTYKTCLFTPLIETR